MSEFTQISAQPEADNPRSDVPKLYAGRRSAMWAAGLAVCAGAVGLFAAPDPISWDGVFYVESAANFVRGLGFVTAPQELTATGGELYPLALFPPGLSIVIAFVALLGLSAADAALWVTHVSWIALPVCAMSLFRALNMRTGVAATLTALVTFSPGIVESGLHVHSDILFLDLVLLSTWGLVVYARRPDRLLPLIISGGLAGCAYAIRNVGLAFLAAGAAFFFASILDYARRRRAGIDWRGLSIWLAAVVPIVLALKIRTLMLFGVLEPYTMPPSDVGAVDNTRWLIFATLSDITAVRGAGWLAWNKVGLLGILVLAALLLWRCGHASLRWILRLSEGDRRIVCLLLVYAATGGAMLVATRTLYDWKAIIDERYATQYTWVLLTLVAFSWPLVRPAVASLLAVGAAALLVARAVIVLHLFTNPHPPILTAEELNAATTFLASMPNDAAIVSNEAATLRFATMHDVRQLGARRASTTSLFENLASAVPQVAPRPLYGAFVVSDVPSPAAGAVHVISTHGRLVFAAAGPAR